MNLGQMCPQCGSDASVAYRLPVALDAQNKYETAAYHERTSGHWCCGACAIREWRQRKQRVATLLAGQAAGRIGPRPKGRSAPR